MTCKFFTAIRKLLPKGRLFQAFFGTDYYNFLEGLAGEPERICEFSKVVRNSGIPGLIPLEALDDWEAFLALSNGSALTVEERNNRIISKISQVGGGGPDYIERILELEFGEDFEIIENLDGSISPFAAQTMGDGGTMGDGSTMASFGFPDGLLITGPPIFLNRKNYDNTMGDSGTMGDGSTMGSFDSIDIVEKIYQLPSDSSLFPLIFFITGPGGVGDFVDLPAFREYDFIKTVVNLKPLHTWAIAQVNFI